MSVSLQKGGNVSLTKTDATLKKLVVGLGWNVRATDGAGFDLDAMAFCLGENGRVRNDNDFIFYNNLQSLDGTVKHTGDNRTGDGDGDDESLIFELDGIPADIKRIVIAVNIHDAKERGQNFGQVSDAFIRCVNAESDNEIARFDLSEDASTETAMIFGEIYRHNGEWKFKAIAQGYKDGLAALATSYGVNIS